MHFRLAALPLVLLAVMPAGFSQSQADASHAVTAEMRNVMYHFTDTIGVHVVQLNGKLVPKREIPIFDDKQSFILEIDSATIGVTTDALTHVLNEYVFAAKDAPPRDLSVSREGDRIKIKGKLADKGNIPFETESEIQATPDGKIRLHSKHIKAAHLPVKGMMDLFGVKLANLINTKKVSGVSAEKD